MLLVRPILRRFGPRQFVYLIYPLLYAMVVLSLTAGSWIFFFILSVCFFFSMDAVILQDKKMTLDIANFYLAPISRTSILFRYLYYRCQHSFIFSFLPALTVGLIFLSTLPPEILQSDSARYFTFITLFIVSWMMYLTISTPLVFAGMRSKTGMELFKAPGYLFYIGFIITQLNTMKVAMPFSMIVIAFITFLLGIVSAGYYFAWRFFRQENLFPE